MSFAVIQVTYTTDRFLYGFDAGVQQRHLSNGSLIWTATPTAFCSHRGMVVDVDDGVFLVGNRAATLDPITVGGSVTLPGSSGDMSIVYKLYANGSAAWGRSFASDTKFGFLGTASMAYALILLSLCCGSWERSF
jgi:hypothetical protein